MIELTGKRAVVCGSTQGIGRAVAELLARLGAAVTLVARDEAALREVLRGLDSRRTGAGQSHHFVTTDFRDPAALHDAVARHVANAGPQDILVNNTGGPPPGPIVDARPEEFLEALTMHLLCNQVLVQTLLPGMRERGYGRIINIVSTSVREPIPGLGISNTTRAAVAAWAKTLAGELAPLGITVNNVLPGYTETTRLRALIQARAQRQNTSEEAVERTMKAQTPMGRFARPEEIAAAVAFLASPAAAYITGVSLPVDGGRIAAI